MSTPFNQDPLSVRLNNPGNLRFAGQAGAVADPSGFARFNSPEEGMTAMQRQLELDLQKRGLTLGEFLNKYAPPSENNTQNYLQFVSQKAGLDPSQRVPSEAIPKVMDAMINMEGGQKASQVYSSPQVAQAPSQTATDAPPAEAGSVFEKYSTGFGKALDANDTEAAEYLSKDVQEKLRKGISKARSAKDEEAAQFLEQQLLQTTDKIYSRAQQSGNPKLAESVRSQARKGGKWDNDVANADPIWIQNAKTLFRDVEGKDFAGTPQEAADWLKNYMGQFNYNLVSTGTAAVNADSWSDAGKVAFLQAMKDYDELPVSMEGFGRFLKGIGTDPTTYVGLGVGSVVSKITGRTAAKAGIEQAIKQGLEKNIAKRIAGSTAAKVGAEGAVYSGAGNVLEQAAEVGAGGKEGIDLGEAALATGTGAAVGAGAGKIIDRLTGRTAVENFVRRSGSEAGAKVDAEIVQDLQKVVSNPNLRGNDLQAIQANALETRYINDVNEALKKVGKTVSNLDEIKSAVNNRRILTPDELNNLRTTVPGRAAADAIEKAQRLRAMTSAVPSAGGATRLVRAGLDLAPVPQAVRYVGQRLLGARQPREEVIGRLLSPDSLKAAGRVSDSLGPSAASQSMQDLQAMANRVIQQNQARAQAQASAQAAQQAQNASVRNQVLQQTRMPLGGSFQELLDGGRSGLNMQSREAIDALRTLKRMGGELGNAADEILKSRRVSNENAFYGVQNMLRRLQEGKAGGVPQVGPQAAIDAAGRPIRNPFAYQAAAAGNQARVTQTLASVAQANLSQEGKGAVANAVTQIGTAKTKAQAKLYLETAVQAVSPGEQREARRLLEPLVNQIKNDGNPNLGALSAITKEAATSSTATDELSKLGFKVANPGGEWLEKQKSKTLSNGLNEFGTPASFGTVTGSFKQNVLVPVEVLKQVPGRMGEQTNVRKESIDYLTGVMSKTKRLPQDSGEDYAPFIQVFQDGRPFVNEGNHRIMVAEKLGWKYLPIELRYFNGGEVEKSIFSPENIAKFNAQAEKEGYTLSNYATKK